MLKSLSAGFKELKPWGRITRKIIIIIGTYKNCMLRHSTNVALRAAALMVAGLGMAPAMSSPAKSSPSQLHPDLWPLGSHSLELKGTDAMVDELLAAMSLEE